MLKPREQQRTCPKADLSPLSKDVRHARTGQTFSGSRQTLRESEKKANPPCPDDIS